MPGLQFHSIRAVSDALKAQLVSDGVTAKYALRKRAQIAVKDADPTTGRVVIVPPKEMSDIGPPRFEGESADETRATFTISQWLEIHTWARAATQTDPDDQYAADLEAAETLRNSVLGALEFIAPGANRGGKTGITDAGENVYGVEIVTMVAVFLETLAIPLVPVTPLTIEPDVELTNTHGSEDPADWTGESATGP